jgi:hypothetical protein
LAAAVVFALAIPPSLLWYWSFAACFLSNGGRAIVGDVTMASLPEASIGSSLSDASLGEAASDAAKADVEDTTDTRKLAQSYDFGASSVTVSHIWQLESLGYFVEGSTREPGKETVPEPNIDEATVFEEFFAVGLRMPPHPAFTEILLKFWVQLH